MSNYIHSTLIFWAAWSLHNEISRDILYYIICSIQCKSCLWRGKHLPTIQAREKEENTSLAAWIHRTSFLFETACPYETATLIHPSHCLSTWSICSNFWGFLINFKLPVYITQIQAARLTSCIGLLDRPLKSAERQEHPLKGVILYHSSNTWTIRIWPFQDSCFTFWCSGYITDWLSPKRCDLAAHQLDFRQHFAWKWMPSLNIPRGIFHY